MKFSVAASSLLLLNLALASPILLEPTHPPALAARDPQGPGSNNNNCQAPNGPCRLKEREPQNSGPGGPGDGPGGLRLRERDPEPQGPGSNNNNCQAPNGPC